MINLRRQFFKFVRHIHEPLRKFFSFFFGRIRIFVDWNFRLRTFSNYFFCKQTKSVRADSTNIFRRQGFFDGVPFPFLLEFLLLMISFAKINHFFLFSHSKQTHDYTRKNKFLSIIVKSDNLLFLKFC